MLAWRSAAAGASPIASQTAGTHPDDAKIVCKTITSKHIDVTALHSTAVVFSRDSFALERFSDYFRQGLATEGFAMSILLSALLLQASTAMALGSKDVAATPAEQTKTCRDMLFSSSRLGAIKVCKTRAQWRRWERCHSATRYCPPPTRPTVTMASLPGDKLICKYLKTTGSRLQQQKICATKRQWELTELETQETIRNRQNQSKRLPGQQ